MEPWSELAAIPSPPRPIRRRRGYAQWAMSHLPLVFLLMFASAFWEISLGTLRLLWFSTQVPGQITHVRMTPGEGDPSYEVAVTYRFEDTEYARTFAVRSDEAQTLRPGDLVQVQVLPERPDCGQRYDENYPHGFVTICLVLFALGPLAGLLKMLWSLYVTPWRVRTLLRHGEATVGTLTAKKEVPGRPPTYTVTYTYEPAPGSGETFVPSQPAALSRSTKISREDSAHAQVGEKVIVFYDPKRPRRSLIYQYADYRFTSSGYAGQAQETPVRTPQRPEYRFLVLITASALLFGIGWLFGWW